MNVLGISCQGEQSSVALMVDGEIVSISAESHHSRQRSDHTWPAMAIGSVLSEGGLRREDVDWVGLDGEAHIRFSRVLSSMLNAPFPSGVSSFVATMRDWIGGRLWARETASKRLDIHGSRVRSFSHHKALAWGASVMAGQPHTDVLVVDAQSEWSAASTWQASVQLSPSLQQMIDVPYPHSLGLVVQALSVWLGVEPQSPWAMMSMLAQWGQPNYADLFEVMLPPHPSGGYTLAEGWIRPEKLACFDQESVYTQRWLDALGVARDCRDPWDFTDPKNQRYADMAASLQSVVFRRVLDLVKETQLRSKSTHLCVVGPLFEDSALSRVLIEQGPYADVFLSGLPSSEVGAVGAACLAWSDRELPRLRSEWAVGEDEQLAVMVPHLNVNRWARFRSRGAAEPPGTELSLSTGFDEHVCNQIVLELCDGGPVGWFDGRKMLTQRPDDVAVILGDPTDFRVHRRVVDEMRGGLGFESSILWVLEEDVQALCPSARLDLPSVREGRTAVPLSPDYVDALSGENSQMSDSQIVVIDPEVYPRRAAILQGMKARRGLGVLCATPMSEHGLPAATSGMAALLFFAHSSLNTIHIGDMFLSKRRPDECSPSATE